QNAARGRPPGVRDDARRERVGRWARRSALLLTEAAGRLRLPRPEPALAYALCDRVASDPLARPRPRASTTCSGAAERGRERGAVRDGDPHGDADERRE